MNPESQQALTGAFVVSVCNFKDMVAIAADLQRRFAQASALLPMLETAVNVAANAAEQTEKQRADYENILYVEESALGKQGRLNAGSESERKKQFEAVLSSHAIKNPDYAGMCKRAESAQRELSVKQQELALGKADWNALREQLASTSGRMESIAKFVSALAPVVWSQDNVQPDTVSLDSKPPF